MSWRATEAEASVTVSEAEASAAHFRNSPGARQSSRQRNIKNIRIDFVPIRRYNTTMKGVIPMKKAWTVISLCAVAAIVLIAAYNEMDEVDEKEEL